MNWRNDEATARGELRRIKSKAPKSIHKNDDDDFANDINFDDIKPFDPADPADPLNDLPDFSDYNEEYNLPISPPPKQAPKHTAKTTHHTVKLKRPTIKPKHHAITTDRELNWPPKTIYYNDNSNYNPYSPPYKDLQEDNYMMDSDNYHVNQDNQPDDEFTQFFGGK